MRPFLSTAILFAFSATTFALPASDVAVGKVIELGKRDNQAFALLQELARIGPRLTGSPNAQRACLWAVEKFKSFGIENARIEEWGEMPVGFQRGPRQSAKMVAPAVRELEFTTPSWSPGTEGPLRGPAILEPTTEEELAAVSAKLSGAWVVAPPASEGRRAAPAQLQRKLYELGILGRITSSGSERVTTGGRFTGLSFDNLPTERRITVRKSDMDAIRERLERAEKVELEFDMENTFVPGPIKLYNVIADIVGTERPDEMVIVCAHLDSWDGPGSVGANDNGTGVVSAMEAARILMKSGVKPKRTIRFALWTGEEQGLLGSRGYVQKHKDDWDKISLVLNDDGGTNYHGGYHVIESMAEMFRQAIAPVSEAFPDLPQRIEIVAQMPRGGSSDHASFNMVGVPGFYTIEAGRADYGHVWHTQNDRPEFSIPEYLVQSSVDHAAMSLYFANAASLLPRPATPVADRPLPSVPEFGGWRIFDPLEEHGPECDHDDDFAAYWWDRFLRELPGLARSFVRS